jgi:DNA modification methylase
VERLKTNVLAVVDKLFKLDARELSRVLPERTFVDVVITSPPYWNLKDYGTRKQIGYRQSKEEYLVDVGNVLTACHRISKPSGSLWLVVDDYRENGVLRLLPWEVAECAQSAGWVMRELIIWDKRHSAPWHMKGQMRNVTEYILVLSKTQNYKFNVDRIKIVDELSKWWIDFPERFNPKGKTPTNIWSIPVRTQGNWRRRSRMKHLCPFPTGLVSRILELTTDSGDIVLDPFAGSGVVLAQASAMDRHFIGFEINAKYCRMFETSVKNEVSAEWAEIQKQRDVHAHVNGNFERTILNLRALKYARQVTTPFAELGDRCRRDIKAILCVASIPRKYQRKRPFNVQLYVVVDERRPSFDKALKKAHERSAHPPLSQYEVKSTIKVITASSLRRKTDILDRRFYLYPGYKPRKHAGSRTLLGWLTRDLGELGNQSRIPMLANIAVDVAWAFD